MHNELRYQAKTNAISVKLSKENKNSASSPPIFFFLNENKNKKNMLDENKHKNIS
jgi:hypothetical protein